MESEIILLFISLFEFCILCFAHLISLSCIKYNVKNQNKKAK